MLCLGVCKVKKGCAVVEVEETRLFLKLITQLEVDTSNFKF
jgi:hypothetical protein